ncbi:P-loop ATPase, Sll1717 family [Algoriphagus formosus]|uniref:Uncharacterized protein n=1 Tax=Algoriphagus formosus TaxID=2007308 RepID=A0A4R5URV8_9BACT|nr:hypothetical protein [Algoriphagus aquimaris]TDK41824.1 hypothetical protein E1898_17760 [Algoriphagus aquimaris]
MTITEQNIYQKLGFDKNPFAYTNADEEENLADYFVAPPYYEAIQGDYNSPSSHIVLAPRGSGKTAQRRMIEIWSKDKPVLCVTYDRFELGNCQNLDSVTLNYHLKNIIQKTLLNLVLWIAEYPDTLNNFSKEDKKNLSILSHNYLGEVTGAKVSEVLNDIKSVTEKIKKFWNENIGVLDSLLSFILKKYDLPELDLPEFKQEEKKLSQSYKFQLELIYEYAQKLGFKSIYILIDKVDETHLTTNDSEATFRLIEPLIKDLETHSIKGFAFKYFLWDQIYDFLLKAGRPDRINIHSLIWSRDRLLEMLSKRLTAFSGGNISKLQQIYEGKNSMGIDDAVTILSWRSPRNVIRICQELIAEQTLISADINKLDKRVLDRASLKISEKVCQEIYGQDGLSEIKRLDRELFSINYLATNVYKVSNNAIRPRTTSWMDKGFLFQAGRDRSNSKKPTNLYFIADPRASRLVNSKKIVTDWIQSNWFPCTHCDADIILDLNLVNENMDIECWNCSRPII